MFWSALQVYGFCKCITNISVLAVANLTDSFIGFLRPQEQISHLPLFAMSIENFSENRYFTSHATVFTLFPVVMY